MVRVVSSLRRRVSGRNYSTPLRGHLSEIGIIAPQGANNARGLAVLLASPNEVIPAPASARSDCFNPRPCARGDPQCHRECKHFMKFQSTPLREGRRYESSHSSDATEFQSTPLREGRLTQ